MQSLDNIGLKQFINLIKNEIISVNDDVKSVNEIPLFDIQSLELEIQFVLSQSDTTQGTFDLKILSIGSDTKSIENITHRVKINLKPIASPTVSLHKE